MSEQGAVVIKSEPTGPNAPAPVTPAVDPNRPAWLPQEFKTPEDFAKSYTELKTKAATPPVQTPTDFKKYEEEYAKTGTLSEVSYKELQETKGISKATIDTYIEGQKAATAKAEAELLSVVGGKSEFEKISKWAATALKPADIESFNKVVNGSDPDAIKLALQALKGQYVAANGQQPTLVSGDKNGSTDVFRSVAEVTRAMNDPKYKSDPAYRKDVEQKLARSTVI